MAKSEARDAYSGGAYKKSVYSNKVLEPISRMYLTLPKFQNVDIDETKDDYSLVVKGHNSLEKEDFDKHFIYLIDKWSTRRSTSFVIM